MSDRSINEAALRGLMEVFWNARELDRFDEFFTDDMVLHSGTADYAGPAGVRDGFAAPFMASFPDLHHDTVFLLVDGDMAAIRYHGTGTLERDYGGLLAKGQKLDYYGTVILRLDGGRVAEAWGHSDLDSWVAAQLASA